MGGWVGGVGGREALSLSLSLFFFLFFRYRSGGGGGGDVPFDFFFLPPVLCAVPLGLFLLPGGQEGVFSEKSCGVLVH